MMTTHFSSESGQAVRSPKVPSAAPPPYYINNFVFGEIKRIGSRGRRFPMRRGGPYLSACAAGRQGSGERHRVGALFLLFAHNIAPRERTTARRIERCCLSQCTTTKYGFVRPYVVLRPPLLHSPFKNCILCSFARKEVALD